MNSILRRSIIVFLILCLLSGSALAIYNPPDSQEASSYIAASSASVMSGGTGKLKVEFIVLGTNTMSSIGATTIRIYKSNGTYVTTIRYTDAGRSGMMGYNTSYHSDCETISVSSGTYYAKVYVYARNASGYDEITHTTGTVTIS